jgi:hypothetical protein
MADEKPPNEPIVEDNGFTPEEQAQFDSMRQDSPPQGDGVAPPAPADPPQPAPTVDPAAAAPPVAADGADDEDDEAEPPAAQPPAADGKPAQQPRRVAFGKYQRLKDRAEKTAAELAAEKAERAKDRETQARLDERLRLINEALTAPPATEKPDEDPEPDAEKDIFGWVQWKKRDDARLRQQFDELRQGRQAETADSELFNNYRQEAEVFAQKEPNFVPAYQHLMHSRTVELAQYYFGKDLYDPNTVPLTAQEIGRIKATVANEEKQLVAEAFKTGQSPAARIMSMARGRGFKPPAPAAANSAAPTNGAAPAAPAANGGTPGAPAAAVPGALSNGAAAPTAPNVKDEIAKIRDGQGAALSLSSGGGVPTSPLTPERLANMNEEDFGHLMDSLSESKIKELMGGA